MDDPVQAAAYAAADFAGPHDMFVEKFREIFSGVDVCGKVLDLGCGPADISIRFAKAYPECLIDGVDGAKAMLQEGVQQLRKENLVDRIHLIQGLIPDIEMPETQYNVIISNSLLHHLHDPAGLWQCIKNYSHGCTIIYVMDLMRPHSVHKAKELVNTYSGAEPQVLKQDFYNSLCAAFTPEEVQGQLNRAGLSQLAVTVISDRHLLVYGQY